MFLQDYLWLDIETDNDSAICPHNLLFQGEASGVKGSRSVLWKECWIQLFIGVNDNVWLSVENELVTASAGPTEGLRWGVFMILLRELKPLAVWSSCRWPYWEQCKDSVATSAGSLGRPGQDFSENLLPGFSATWSLEASCWSAKAEFTIRSLIQSPWKIMERIKALVKSCVRPKQNSTLEETSLGLVNCQPDCVCLSTALSNCTRPIYGMLRLWSSPYSGSWKHGGISFKSMLMQLMENLNEVRPCLFFLDWYLKNRLYFILMDSQPWDYRFLVFPSLLLICCGIRSCR